MKFLMRHAHGVPLCKTEGISYVCICTTFHQRNPSPRNTPAKSWSVKPWCRIRHSGFLQLSHVYFGGSASPKFSSCSIYRVETVTRALCWTQDETPAPNYDLPVSVMSQRVWGSCSLWNTSKKINCKKCLNNMMLRCKVHYCHTATEIKFLNGLIMTAFLYTPAYEH